MSEFIKNFTELNKDDTHIAGGKGASLGEMTKAGMQVPPGFVVTAQAFEQFLTETDLRQEIEAQIDKVNYEDVNSVEEASITIADLIHDARFPKDLQKEILEHFRKLDSHWVAVRSSATAEDSSTASWAGELESYMNNDRDHVIGSIKKCWASLFTPRAIVYRNEKGLRKTKVSVAVVVQAMIESDVSGITFTVHPVTKDKNQMIIEAGFGLGEAIVGGQITPDSYVINKDDGEIVDINIVKQDKMITRDETEAGGNHWVNVEQSKMEKQKLSGEQIIELAEICTNIEDHYGFPCDIEWAMTKKLQNWEFFITQSRPITTL
ncbi:PEP/pyruvate-binding domain-containing protein [Patescibacteria group bacterium]